jgi:hypothetical protein
VVVEAFAVVAKSPVLKVPFPSIKLTPIAAISLLSVPQKLNMVSVKHH